MRVGRGAARNSNVLVKQLGAPAPVSPSPAAPSSSSPAVAMIFSHPFHLRLLTHTHTHPPTHTNHQTDSLDHTEFPAGPKPPSVAAQLIRDKRLLDANPRLNLASFVATSVEPECQQIMVESLSTNFVDEEEYPSSTEIHSTCVKQLADLLHAEDVCGTSTVGSSEAIMLGVLAMKHRWRQARAAAGKPTDKPNMVTPSSIHVCHEKGECVFPGGKALGGGESECKTRKAAPTLRNASSHASPSPVCHATPSHLCVSNSVCLL